MLCVIMISELSNDFFIKITNVNKNLTIEALQSGNLTYYFTTILRISGKKHKSFHYIPIKMKICEEKGGVHKNTERNCSGKLLTLIIYNYLLTPSNLFTLLPVAR